MKGGVLKAIIFPRLHIPSIHFKSFPSAPQEQGSDDEDEEELTPAEVVQRMKVRDLSKLYLGMS